MNLKIKRIRNNCFCKEKCCLCDTWFDPDYYIYDSVLGYVCDICVAKVKALQEPKKKSGKKSGKKSKIIITYTRNYKVLK